MKSIFALFALGFFGYTVYDIVVRSDYTALDAFLLGCICMMIAVGIENMQNEIKRMK